MKRMVFFLFGLVFASTLTAQRFAVVDTDLILNKMPAYTSAQKQLDQLSGIWAGEVEAIRSEVEALRKSYEAEKVLLTKEMKKERLGNCSASISVRKGSCTPSAKSL